jgi:hypothetical protein
LRAVAGWVRTMLRFKVLVSVVPLIGAALLARLELVPGPRPCISLGADTLQIASSPWHADLHVSFTDDPALATVRVALTDSAATADFVVVDDPAEAEGDACRLTPATRFVAVSTDDTQDAPVIYLSDHGPADYRIFVESRRFTPREAAALIVGARGGQARSPDQPADHLVDHLADASL